MGALLDSEILAEVYLELIGGRQPDFALSTEQNRTVAGSTETWRAKPRVKPLPDRLSDQEREAHEAFIEKLGDGALWLRT